ncbi:FAD-binding oxidoreductase [Streptomyces sp. PSKA54]|uniref:FAD-binding oxidoreductase n=1 Tax=Streptomyces himalayensis subsp. aureolus TaxID=2758039 RepID=A0A7W2D3X3_9ACTN|nr:FAD-binding oxidoreductase [Streptomyces himalayensis]MBA4864176.1 FAD-binding oxidoreductase [Streptomyces himalayensis subsp. aureolus]
MTQAKIVRRGDSAYEAVLSEMVWNDLKPQRFPEMIVRAESEQDVQEALRLARSRGLRIAVRAGGHSWIGSPVRDGGMLIDLSGLRQCVVDPEARTAAVQPGVTGSSLAAQLAPYGLAFPAGHCGSVAVSGYLLSGGLGWNSGAWGPGCASVRAIEAVTADGHGVRCSEHENPDLFWAARGAGPGFFAVVTRFHLRLWDLPAAILETTYTFPLAELGAVAAWATEAADRLPPTVEASFLLGTADPSDSAAPYRPKVVKVTATAFAASRDEAVRSLEPLRTCPLADRALSRQVDKPTTYESLYATSGTLWPEGHRCAVDTLWSDDTFETLLRRLAPFVAEAPSERSVVLAPFWPASRDRGLSRNMAFSALGDTYVAPFAIWSDPEDDDLNIRWLRDTMGAVEPLGTGHYVAEADLTAAPSRAERSYTPEAWQRLQALRARYDPEGLFHTYLTT